MKILPLLFAALLAGSTPALASTQPAQETTANLENVKITKKTITPKEGIEITYPELSGLPNKDVEHKLNALFKEEVTLISEKNVQEYKAGFKIPFRRDNLLNILFDTYVFTGGAHGMSTKTSVIANLETGDIYMMKDLFKPGSDYIERLSEIIKKQDKEHKLDAFHKFETINEKDGFYLEETGIVIYFDPYEYTPYYMGFPEFHIPYSEIKDIINTRGPMWNAMQTS